MVSIDNQPWFVAVDVAACLGFTYENLKYHLKANLGTDEKTVLTKGSGSLTTLCLFPGTTARVTLISESGLYKLTMRSDKPEARQFQDWVTA